MKRVGWVRRAGLVLDLVGLLALAFGVAGIVGAIWLEVYLAIQGIPPLERLPDPYLAFATRWIFRGLFVVVLLMGLARMRRRGTEPLARDRLEPAQGLRRMGFWPFAIFMGQAVLAFTIALAFAEWAAWIYVRWYAHDMGVPLHELSEDYGMAFDSVLLRIMVFLVALPLSLWRLRATRISRQPTREIAPPVEDH